jgi:hypothetical protein
MRTSWVCGMLGLTAVIAVGSSAAEAAYCLEARNDASPRIVSYNDVGEFVRYGQPAPHGAALTGLQPAAPVLREDPLTYSVIDASEELMLSGVRVVMRVHLSREAGESELRGIGDEIIRRESARRRLSAVAVVYYLADAAAADACAFGTAVWAPHGNWDATRTVRLGDYTHHQLVVAGAAHRWRERAASVVRSGAVVARTRQERAADAHP